MTVSKVFYFIVTILSFSFSYAQSINSGGGTASSAVGNVSYSIGQLFYVSNESTTGNENQGIQNTYISEVISGFSTRGNITLFPNPTADYVYLEFLKTSDFVGGYYRILSTTGQIHAESPLIKSQKIDLSHLGTGVYLLEINDSKGKSQTRIKIIKTKN